MPGYVALLYTIGLPGNVRLKMGDLRAFATAVGLDAPRTIGATGNLVFAVKGRRSLRALETLLETRFAETFGRRVPMILRSAGDFSALPAKNPFGRIHHPQRVAVRLMRNGYPPAFLDELRRYVDDEDVAVVDGDLWIGFRSEPARSRVLSAFSRRRFFAEPGTFRALSMIARIAATLE
jgi:uncharacterized protein (DUF1697 family)